MVAKPTAQPPSAPTPFPGLTETPHKRILNFDTVLPQPVEITANGKTLTLRDNVPWVDVVRVFEMMELQASYSARETMSSAETRVALLELTALTSDICLSFVRWSFPEMTLDEVNAWLDYDQQQTVVMLFFQIRSNASFRQSTALLSALSAPNGADQPANPLALLAGTPEQLTPQQREQAALLALARYQQLQAAQEGSLEPSSLATANRRTRRTTSRTTRASKTTAQRGPVAATTRRKR